MISHLASSPHPTSWLGDVMHLLTAVFPQVPRAAARWRARRHGVTTLPALADYHERPRRTLTTRRAGDRTGMLAESHSLGETAGRRLSVASRGSYDKAGTWAWGGPYGPSGVSPLGLTPWHKHAHPPLRLINSVEQTRTRPSHGKVLASLSYESLGVCFLVRRQTPVGHGVFMPCHERVAPARKSPGYVKWWRTAAIPDSIRMTQISLYTALNNFVPLHCATWLLVPQTDQIHLPHNR